MNRARNYLLFIGLFVVIMAITGTAAAEDPSDSGAACSDSSTGSGTSSTNLSSSVSDVDSGVSSVSGISVTSSDSDAVSGSDSTASEVASADTSNPNSCVDLDNSAAVSGTTGLFSSDSTTATENTSSYDSSVMPSNTSETVSIIDTSRPNSGTGTSDTSNSNSNTVPAQQSETTSENADTQDNLKIDTTNPEDVEIPKIPDPRNTRTNESFTTIQGAIDDPDTMDGDEIMVEAGTYTENVIANKNLTIKPVSGDNVIVQASNPNIPVFTVTSTGSGSTIQGFTITGATNSCGVYLDSADNCTIDDNVITENLYGIYLYNSSNNTISGNTVQENERGVYVPAECISWEEYADYYNLDQYLGDPELEPIWWDEYWFYQTHYSGISSTSLNNRISGNNINNNEYGIYMQSDSYSEPDNNDNHIIENNIVSNDYGIYVYNSAGNVHFNRITENQFGLYLDKGRINAINNWWGSNNPELTVEPSESRNNPNYVAEPSDIYMTREYYDGSWNDSWPSGEVEYDPWLVLNINATPNTISNQELVITADLTRNSREEDTSFLGHITDGTIITFTTTMGIINSNVTTDGKAVSTLTPGALPGTASVSAGLDHQETSTQIINVASKAILTITRTAVDPYKLSLENLNGEWWGGGELNLTMEIPLDDPVSWVSVVIRQGEEPYTGELDVERVHFVGGELTTYPLLSKVADFAKNELDIFTKIGHSNGYNLAPQGIDAISVSIKSLSEDFYNRYTGKSNRPVLKNFKAAYKMGIKVDASSVYIPGLVEQDEIERIAEFIANIDPHIPYHITGYIPVPGAPWRVPSWDEIMNAKQVAEKHMDDVEVSWFSSFDDYVEMINENPQYQKVTIV